MQTSRTLTCETLTCADQRAHTLKELTEDREAVMIDALHALVVAILNVWAAMVPMAVAALAAVATTGMLAHMGRMTRRNIVRYTNYGK